ncbi:MAG: S41 family peptidase [Oscillochloridaceae bacterium umkhey_bin13]
MIRKSHAMLFGVVIALLAGTLGFGSGWAAARIVGNSPVDSFLAGFGTMGARQDTPTNLRNDFAVFWQVWNLVEGEFYRTEPLDQQRMIYGAIRGMLSALDDEYTSFQEPDLAAQSRESMQGKFEGIGAFLRLEDRSLLIDRPFKGSPAEQAGVLAGDEILAVDGVPMSEIIAGVEGAEATARAVSRIRGPKGSVVTLTLRRDGVAEPFEVAITRDEVPLISVNAEMLDDGVAYIQITEFKATTTEQLDAAIRELMAQRPTSLVLDLRNNPGGYLNTAREVLGRFYNGVALYEQENGGLEKELRTINAPADARIYDLPMVVLINGGSASASEIVAGALRDVRPNTTLLGEQSFGKGSVQNIHQLNDGSSARITVARWFTPNRSAIHKLGITPEYVVAQAEGTEFQVPCLAERRPAEGQTACFDAQLASSLRLLAGMPPLPATRSGELVPLIARRAAT